MELLGEILRTKGMRTAGLTICREAVRGIILRESKLLMVHSTIVGDYKFPGGGIDVNETHSEALAREIREECGAVLSEFGPAFGKVIEYDMPIEAEYEVFKMTSYYYECQVHAGFMEQKLDQYECDLGFEPVWVEIETALRENKIRNNFESIQIAGWIPRDTFVLEMIRKRIHQV